MSGPETHPQSLSAGTPVGEGVKPLPAPPHRMTGRPPVSDHDLLYPGLHDFCRPESLHLPYHGTLHLGHLGHQILCPAQQGMSAEAVWVPQAISMPVQSLLPWGTNELCVLGHGMCSTQSVSSDNPSAHAPAHGIRNR